MAVTLLLDLGASRLKAGIYDHNSRKLIAQHDIPAPTPVYGKNGEIEIAPGMHSRLCNQLCTELITSAGITPDVAVFCSEMHGFALQSQGQAARYISWRDERAAQSGILDNLQKTQADEFRTITGMRLRAGLPFVTLCHMANREGLPENATVLSLPELVVSELGELTGNIDETMAAGLGLYDLDHSHWSDSLISRLGRNSLKFLRPVRAGSAPIGHIRLAGHDIPVLAAVGDLQAAVYGSGTEPQTQLCVNVGTGSQVSRIGYLPQDPKVEARPFLSEHRLATISHIPAGRALRVFEQFYDSIAGSNGSFWRIAATLTSDEIMQSPLRIDLNCFAGAWRFESGGKIAGILEGNFDARNVACATIYALAKQYVEAMQMIDPEHQCKSIVLAGGVPHRLPVLGELLGRESCREVQMRPNGEETLAGLINLANTLAHAR